MRMNRVLVAISAVAGLAVVLLGLVVAATVNWPEGSKLVDRPLGVKAFGDARFWWISEELTWVGDDSGLSAKVPVGFVTDFASIPAPFRSIFSKTGRYRTAAVVHDYLYWTQSCSRKEADDAFKEIMREFGVQRWRRWVIHKAVRGGGGAPWRKNKEARLQGQVRVIPSDKLPTDPLETWDDCRRRLRGEA